MNLFKLYRSRKYLLRILLYMTLLIAVFLIISSTLQYYNSRGTVLDNQQEMNKKVLSQVNYNINFMNELVKTLAMSIYFDADIISLMNSKTIEIYDLYPKLNRLRKIVNSNTFVHSIIVYNEYNGCFYSTLSSCRDDEMNLLMDRYLSNRDSLAKLVFVPMTFPGASVSAGQIDFFSYFMYESRDRQYWKQSTFIINIKPEWLFDNVDNINELTDPVESSILIMDGSGRVFAPAHAPADSDNSASRSVFDRLNESGATSGYYTEGSGKNRKIISYMASEVNDWLIVNVQAYQSVLGKVDKMKTASILMIAIFLVLSVVCSALLSLKLYQPIDNIVNVIRKFSSRSSEDLPRGRDELSFISSEYQQVIGGMKQLRTHQDAQAQIMKSYYLKKLITDNSRAAFQELCGDLIRSGLKINLDQPMIVCVLKIDRYNEFHAGTNDEEKKLIKFAIANISGEIISSAYPNEIVEMRNDHVLILINIPAVTERLCEDLAVLLRKIQQNMFDYYKLSLTAALSEQARDYGEIAKCYGQAMEYSHYRIIYGRMSVITPSMLRSNLNNLEFQIPSETERKLSEAIRSNDPRQIEEQLTALLDFISRLNFNSMTFSILHLIATINNLIREINNANVHQISIDMQAVQQKVLEQETLAEIRILFDALIAEIVEKRSNVVDDSKNQIIADTIKEIIEQNYRDLNLSLQSISTTMKMSTAHISKIFRSALSVSIADYITEVRLNQALELLEHNNYNIIEIMDKVGFANRSYFFKLFKRRYGTTPKEYRTKKIIK